MRGLAVVLASLVWVSCQKAADSTDQKTVDQTATSTGSGKAGIARPKTEQVKPPFDLKTPPPDAVKTASGLVYKKTVTVPGNDAGPAPKRTAV